MELLQFDATGLAVSFTNVFGVSGANDGFILAVLFSALQPHETDPRLSSCAVGVGLATACDTLCSQAFGGNDKRKVGLAAQRGE